MSASLVGSEMCIRDSVRRQSCCQSACSLPEDLSMPVLLAVVGMPTTHLDCLLYTSDAADDM
eukprot:2289432-Alexandrium_andersonii.AAC.1